MKTIVNISKRGMCMRILEYIECPDEAKRMKLVGNDIDDVKHAPSPEKSDFHAGLFGIGIPKGQAQEARAKAMAGT